MLKMSISLITLILAQTVGAQGLICQQNPRDVRFELAVTSEKVRLFVLSPMGYSYLSMMDIPVSESSLSQLKYQATQLKPLGDQFSVEWKAEDCHFKIESPLKETMLECGKAEKSSANKIEFLSFTIATITDQSFAGTWKSLRFRMAVAVEGDYGADHFFISLHVPETACLSLKSVDKQNKNTPQ